MERISLEGNLLGLRIGRHGVGHLILACAVELSDRIRLHLPRSERHRDRALAFAEILVVGAAHERAFNVDVIALAQLRRGVLAEAVPGISYVEYDTERR